MQENHETDYLLENKLRREAPALQKRAHDTVLVLENILSTYVKHFPNFTDHSLMHSLNVLNYCNLIVGKDNIRALSPEECYVLIMSCYLHDIGMGISEKDYAQYSGQIPFGMENVHYDKSDTSGTIRAFHNEFSGLLIRKYADLLDFPSEELLYAVVQVSRGHRKTDLYDPREYPTLTAGGKPLRLAYLAAVIRIADEIDVGSDRNPELLFAANHLTQKNDIEIFGTHESIHLVEVEEKQIILVTRPKAPEYVPLIQKLAEKLQTTLDYCRDAAAKRSDLRITQEQITITEA